MAFGWQLQPGPPHGQDLQKDAKADEDSSDDESNKTAEKDPVEENGPESL